MRGMHEESIMVKKSDLINYPIVVSNLLRDYSLRLKLAENMQYPRAILDSFHPGAKGARIPRIVPFDTGVYSTYYSYSMTLGTGVGPTLVISNHTVGTSDVMYIISPTATISTTSLFSSTPATYKVLLTVDGPPENFSQSMDLDLIELPVTTSNYKTLITKIGSSFNSALFTRQQLVASTTRIFKTSTR